MFGYIISILLPPIAMVQQGRVVAVMHGLRVPNRRVDRVRQHAEAARRGQALREKSAGGGPLTQRRRL